MSGFKIEESIIPNDILFATPSWIAEFTRSIFSLHKLVAMIVYVSSTQIVHETLATKVTNFGSEYLKKDYYRIIYYGFLPPYELSPLNKITKFLKTSLFFH